MKRRLSGKIVSNKMDKTLVVLVERVKTHPIYKKKYKVSKRFKVHTENSKEMSLGSMVTIEESRPLSKEKRWVLIQDQNLKTKNQKIEGKKK